tara:strand:- start:571 stop:966 length:396 start_codon:yes stop_codon:yes gene_type:complete
MEENFKLEIISPEKIVFSKEVQAVTLPSYEGEMTILKNHISIITFLKPGIVKAGKSSEDSEKFFVEDGTVEFNNNNLVILSESVINVKNITKDFIAKLNENTQNKLSEKNISDHDKYILNHKLEAIKEIRI